MKTFSELTGDEKNSLKQLIVEFTIPKGKFKPFSWAIRFFQWKWWTEQKWSDVPSHVRIRFYDKKHSVWWVYEASRLSVRLVGYDYLLLHNDVIKDYNVYLLNNEKHEFIKFVNNTSGLPYSMGQIFGLLFVKIMKLITFQKIKMSNPLSDGTKAEVCVSAVKNALQNTPRFRAVTEKWKSDDMDLCDTIKMMEELNVDSKTAGFIS